MEEGPQGRARAAWGWAVLAVLLAGLVHVLSTRQSGPHSLQAGLNLQFAQRPTLATALERYPKLRPPLYPLLLRGWMAVSEAPGGLNELLALVTLPLLGLAGRRLGLTARQVAAMLVAWACAHFVYVNHYQWTAEALVVPLGLALLLALMRDREAPRTRTAVAVGTLVAALLLCRYFSLFYVVPVTGIALLTVALPWRARVARAVAVLVLAGLPLVAWMGVAHRETGYWTGVARTGPRPAAEQVHWREMTTFDSNLRLLGRTIALDFLSDHRAGVLSAVTEPLEPTPTEWLLLVAAAACLAIAVPQLVRARDDARLLLCGGFLACYLVALVVVWTGGNNDPLHTRFLFPAYPFLVLLAFAVYSRLASRWLQAPFVLLFALVLGVQLPRSWVAEPLPVRFDSVSPLEAGETGISPGESEEDSEARRERVRRRREERRGQRHHPAPASPAP